MFFSDFLCHSFHSRTSKLEPHGDLIFDGDFRFQEKGVGEAFDEIDFHANRFAGPDHALETDVAHAGGHRHSLGVGGEMARKEDRPALHRRFAQQHARH